MGEQNWNDQEFVEWYNRELKFSKAQMEDYHNQMNLNSEDVFLDLGCGNGDFLEFLADKVAHVVGIDTSPDQLALAREKLQKFANAKVLSLQFETFRPNHPELSSYAFTKAFARKSFHHLQEPEKKEFCANLAASLKKGGLFVIEDMIFTFPLAELPAKKESIIKEASQFYGEKWNYMERAFIDTLLNEFPTGLPDLRRMLEENGFSIEKVVSKSSFYTIVFARFG